MPQGRLRRISASQLKSRVHERTRERPEGGEMGGSGEAGKRQARVMEPYLNLLDHCFYRPPIIPTPAPHYSLTAPMIQDRLERNE